MNIRYVVVFGLVLLTACSRPGIQGVKTYSYPSGQHQPGLVGHLP
jgi:hypothetical protein